MNDELLTVSEAAKRLRMSKQGLHARLKRWGIRPVDGKISWRDALVTTPTDRIGELYETGALNDEDLRLLDEDSQTLAADNDEIEDEAADPSKHFRLFVGLARFRLDALESLLSADPLDVDAIRRELAAMRRNHEVAEYLCGIRAVLPGHVQNAFADERRETNTDIRKTSGGHRHAET